MLLSIIVFIAVSACFVASNNFGPRYPATKGEVWPKPKNQVTESIYYNIDHKNFNITVTGETCNILASAIERYSFILRDFSRLTTQIGKRDLDRKRTSTDPNFRGQIHTLNVTLLAPCEEYPYFGMDESYNLTVDTITELTGFTVWGVLRGLETWTHLFYLSDDANETRMYRTVISDSPRYLHRGLLIDTSRHYVSLSNIQKTLDAMTMNKMNVLHWHIVDDESFPYQSEKFPNLSRLGAYHSSLVYTKENIKMIINYARDRAIRVLPEFNVPGRTSSWGKAYPNLLTTCYDQDGKPLGLGPMNPIKNTTYKLLQDLFTEIQDWFPDRFFHVGGDEVDLACWESNPVLKQYMKQKNITSGELYALFMKNVIPLLGHRSTPIVWQKVFDEGVPLPVDTLVQVWISHEDLYKMSSILSAGYKLIYSTSWFLDNLQYGGDWESFYKKDPRQRVAPYVNPNTNLENIVGGEACMWGEAVNDMNIISRVWPRASAIAEKLWSPETDSSNSIPESVYHRLEEHTCRMNSRGIHAQPPSGPGFCVGADIVSADEAAYTEIKLFFA